MSKYSWDFGVPDYFLQIQEALNTLAASATAISKTWEAAVSKYDYSGVHTALNACLENYRSISIQMSSVAKSILPLIDTSVYDTLKASTAMTKALQSVDWSWVISAYAEAFGDVEVEDNNATQNPCHRWHNSVSSWRECCVPTAFGGSTHLHRNPQGTFWRMYAGRDGYWFGSHHACDCIF